MSLDELCPMPLITSAPHISPFWSLYLCVLELGKHASGENMVNCMVKWSFCKALLSFRALVTIFEKSTPSFCTREVAVLCLAVQLWKNIAMLSRSPNQRAVEGKCILLEPSLIFFQLPKNCEGNAVLLLENNDGACRAGLKI